MSAGLESSMGNRAEQPVFTPEIPAITACIELPKIIHRGHVLRESMHVNMLEALKRAFTEIKSNITSKILVEGRLLTQAQWDRLLINREYQFYMCQRYHRIDSLDHADISLVIPESITITPEDAQSHAMRLFDVNSLTTDLGYTTAWYSPGILLHPSGKTIPYVEHPNAVLGAVNAIRIGSNDTTPGVIGFIARRITEVWDAALDDYKYTGPEYVEADQPFVQSRVIPLL